MTTVLLTVTLSPSNSGTRARRKAAAMQPPVGVPAKGGPLTLALVTRPEGAKVMTTVAVPEGSSPLRQLEAWLACVVSALIAACRSKPAPTGARGADGRGVTGGGRTGSTRAGSGRAGSERGAKVEGALSCFAFGTPVRDGALGARDAGGATDSPGAGGSSGVVASADSGKPGRALRAGAAGSGLSVVGGVGASTPGWRVSMVEASTAPLMPSAATAINAAERFRGFGGGVAMAGARGGGAVCEATAASDGALGGVRSRLAGAGVGSGSGSASATGISTSMGSGGGSEGGFLARSARVGF